MLAKGTRLGPYEIESLLGAGGMGEVYQATDPRLGRSVAIKVLPSAFSADAERLRRFEQEAHAAAALNHPNILAVYDIGAHESSPFIVSELLQGETLRDRLAKSGLGVRRAVEYGVQIARGLAAAHERGIVHRDLKPENIFVTADGRAKILDFGLAKLLQTDTALRGNSALPTEPPQTQPGTLLGTMGYMAPEQVRGLDADHRADIFAFGTILYEMLAGTRAFGGATPADTISAILDKDPPEMPLSARAIPPALERIVNRCLEKPPGARFQTAADLAFALEALSSHSDAGSRAQPQTDRSRSRHYVWQTVAVALALSAIAAAALAYRFRPRSESAVYRVSIVPPEGVVVGDPGFSSPARRLAISPDGRRLAFTGAANDGRIRLWIRALDAHTAQAIDGSDGVTFPFWSPDSRFVAFFVEGQTPIKLKRVDINGGPPVTVCDVPRNYASGASWSTSDVILLSGGPTGGLLRVPAAGGTPTTVTEIHPELGEVNHWAPVFLPDGRHFVYMAVGSKTGGAFDLNGVYLSSLDSQERKLLLPGGSNVGFAHEHLLFLREQTLVAQPLDVNRGELTGNAVPIADGITIGGASGRTGAFAVSENVLLYQTGPRLFGTTARGALLSRLAWVDRTGKRIGEVGDVDANADLELSPDEHRAAISVPGAGGTRDIWNYDIARGLRTRFTFDPADELGSVWSPDSTQVIFNSRRRGHLDLYRKAASGGDEEELLFADDADKYPMDWSRDGRFLLFSRVAGPTVDDIWVLPLTGDRKPFPYLQTPFNETNARFSPDTRWIAYSSNESGKSDIYVASFPQPTGKWQVSQSGGFHPLWRRDGRELYYTTAADNSTSNNLMAAALATRAGSIEIGAIRPLFQTGLLGGSDFVRRRRYSASGDGQRFLLLSLEGMSAGASAPLSLIVNWATALRDR